MPLDNSKEKATDNVISIAVVGRPNVGKSSLVNRIVGKRIAIVEERPGVTRDRLYLTTSWRGRPLQIIDTGGIAESGSLLDKKVSGQALKAVQEADVVLFVADVTTGLTFEDEGIVRLLRRMSDKVIPVANKVDSQKQEILAVEFYALGFGDPILISALHGRGTGDLLDHVLALTDKKRTFGYEPSVSTSQEISYTEEESAEDLIDEDNFDKEDDLLDFKAGGNAEEDLAVAIVGRPNVGKSTLFNLLVGDERSIVHDMPGTTRDAIDTVIETDVGKVRFVDTAGMRRKTHIVEGAEYYSLVRALAAIDKADVALLIIDGTEGVTHQEQSLAERIDASGSPIVIVMNKWDLLSTEERLAANEQVQDKLFFLSYAPIIRISAKTKLGVNRILPAIAAANEAYSTRIPTAKLNEAIKMAHAGQPPAKGRILYAVQGGINPPTFTLFTTSNLQPSYIRYIEKFLRERFELGPTPLKFRVRIR